MLVVVVGDDGVVDIVVCLKVFFGGDVAIFVGEIDRAVLFDVVVVGDLNKQRISILAKQINNESQSSYIRCIRSVCRCFRSRCHR